MCRHLGNDSANKGWGTRILKSHDNWAKRKRTSHPGFSPLLQTIQLRPNQMAISLGLIERMQPHRALHLFSLHTSGRSFKSNIASRLIIPFVMNYSESSEKANRNADQDSSSLSSAVSRWLDPSLSLSLSTFFFPRLLSSTCRQNLKSCISLQRSQISQSDNLPQ